MASFATSSRTLRTLVVVAGALLLLTALGTAGYMTIEGWGFFDALYMTVTTITTVGFGEVRPLDTSGQVLTLVIVLMGVVIALTGISLTAALIAEGEIGGRTRRRRMDRAIGQLHDHFIVCAYGRVGRAAVRELRAAGVAHVVIDPKEELRERHGGRRGALPHRGGHDRSAVLRTAGVDRARALVCAVDSDATNVYIALIARSLNPGLFIVARSSEPGSAERLERAGADRVVSPYVSSARHMVRMACDPSIVDLFDESAAPDDRSKSRSESWMRDRRCIGQPVSSLPGRCWPCGRAPGTSWPCPRRDAALAAGDIVLLSRGDPAAR